MAKQRIYKPKDDNEFLADLAFIIFVSGFRYSVVEKRFPMIEKAFHGFNIAKLSKYGEKDIERLMKSKGMIRNRGKIAAIIENARICSEIKREHGSVLKWIDSLKKNYKKSPLFSPSLEESFLCFKRIGKTTSGWLAMLHNARKSYIEFDAP